MMMSAEKLGIKKIISMTRIKYFLRIKIEYDECGQHEHAHIRKSPNYYSLCPKNATFIS